MILCIKVSLLLLIILLSSLLSASDIENSSLAIASSKIQSIKDNSTIETEILKNTSPKGLSPRTRENYDNERFEKIIEAFSSIQKYIPIILTELVGGYDYHYDENVDEFYEKIMNKLEVPMEERRNLDFYKNNFATQLLDLITESENIMNFIDNKDPFWSILERLLFKWILYMRKRFADNDQLFESTVLDAKPIIRAIHSGLGIEINPIDRLLSRVKFDFSVFDHLVKYESFDDPPLVEKFIKEVINDLYNVNADNDKEDYLLKMTCQELKIKYFNGNFNNNPLLKLMIIKFLPVEIVKQFKEKCLSNERIKLCIDLDFVTAMLKVYSNNDNNNDDIIAKSDDVASLETIEEDYVNMSLIRFLANNNLGFRVKRSLDLVRILRKMEKQLGSLPSLNQKGNQKTILSIKKIIKFKCKDGIAWKQDDDLFKEYLNRQRHAFDASKGIGISLDEYNRYVDII